MAGVALALALAAALSGCGGIQVEGGELTPVEAPEFTLPDVNGRAVSLSDHEGKVILLDFWATWCAPCIKELPMFQALQNQYHEEGVAIIGIAMDDNAERIVPPFLEKRGIQYTNLIGNREIEQLYGPLMGIPTFVLIDRDGQIRRKETGTFQREQFEEWITELL